MRGLSQTQRAMEKTTQVAKSTSAALDRLHALVDRTSKANPKAKEIQALRSHLEENPDLWRIYGDVSEVAFDRQVTAMAGEQAAIVESLTAGRGTMREELGHHQASALERLLIDQVIQCWLRLYGVDNAYTSALEGNAPRGELDYWDRRLSAAHSRFLRACEALARIRKLRLPSLQLNIGAKQVNVANG